MIYKNKKVLIIGLGISGRTAAKLLQAQGACVHGIDRNEASLNSEEVRFLKGMTTSLESDVRGPLNYDLVVISPGVPSTNAVLIAAKQQGIEVIGEIELGCRLVKNRVLGITGTNGKTTVTLLVEHVLNYCGHKARALGNVGIPFSEELIGLDPEVTIVLELSSYQLETLSQRVLDGGVILNITPDHLDRYPGMEEYAAAKMLMENCLKPGAPLYIEDKTYHDFGYLLNQKPLRYGYSQDDDIYTDLKSVFQHGKVVFKLPEGLRGKQSHDVENIMGAFALCAISGTGTFMNGITGEEFAEALRSFEKPKHRIEFVLSRNGICYYDDSKGTNIDAVIRAVEFLNGPIVLIAGGVDKGAPYTPWVEVFRNKVKCICAIGQAAAKMQSQLSHAIPVRIVSDMEQAVREATAAAKEGGIVLLSPGCSSFDMFIDYAHRGEVFQKEVKRLMHD